MFVIIADRSALDVSNVYLMMETKVIVPFHDPLVLLLYFPGEKNCV